jgi:hypothetical protein
MKLGSKEGLRVGMINTLDGKHAEHGLFTICGTKADVTQHRFTSFGAMFQPGKVFMCHGDYIISINMMQ